MSDLGSDSGLARAGARLWAWGANHRTATIVLLYALFAVIIGLSAFPRLFSGFGIVDDEGTLLISLHSFVNGETLYRDVYSPYGPFYFELFGGFFSLTGFEVTNNAGRLIVLVLWILSAGLSGAIAQRLTGSLALGLGAMVVSFGALDILVSEPMHPHGLNVLLLTCFTLLAILRPRRGALVAAGVAGALLGALALTKVNVGAYAFAAVALAAVLAVEPLYRRAWLRYPVVLAFLAMPLLVMNRDLDAEWVRSLVAIEVMAAAAIVVAASIQRPRRGEGEEGVVDWLIVAAVGFVASAGVIVITILLTGTSVGDLTDGVITEALRVRDALLLPFLSAAAAVDWAIVSLAAAVAIAVIRRRGDDGPSVWLGAGRILAGLAIWFTITQAAPLSLAPLPENRLVLALILAWVAIVPPGSTIEGTHRRFVRILVVSLAVAGTLQVYPVAGSQVGIAAAAFAPVGALCIADGLAELRARSLSLGPLSVTRFTVISTALLIALVAKLAVGEAIRPSFDSWRTYRAQQALSFSGADLLRLPQAEADKFERIVALLKENRCTGFIGYANTNSIYLWSGIDPPAPSAPGAWVTALDDETQRRIVAEMMATPRPCALVNEGQANLWLAGRPKPETPLVEYIFGRFESVETIGDYEFMLPVGAAGPGRGEGASGS